MLTRLDHCVLICRDIDAGIKAYTRVFGRGPNWRSINEDFASAIFSCKNTALEIMAPAENEASQERIDTLLGKRQGALTSLAFETGDIEKTHHVLNRRGLRPSGIGAKQSKDALSGQVRSWSSFRLEDAACAGIKTFVLSRPEIDMQDGNFASGTVNRLDHLVIETPDPQRAIAHYGAKLGLRFALDRSLEKFSTRFLFFRVGGLTLELIHRTDKTYDPNQDDKFWGLTWETKDLEAARRRLMGHSLDVSEIRTGRKPGSRVFTVRSGTLDVPTLFIAHDP